MAITQTLPRKSTAKTRLIFILTIIGGFILFALPNVFLGVSKLEGGLTGMNLFWMALFQFTSVTALLAFSLKKLGRHWRDIGLSSNRWLRDTLLGIGVGLAWAVAQFAYIIPATGGATREDISQMLSMYDGTILGLLAYCSLGIIGGGITEELYNRGFFISILKDTFANKTIGLWVAGLLSAVFFALGHLPSSLLMWFDILVPTIAYTLLFIYTKRLMAPILAHSLYNLLAILVTYFIYFK